MVGSDEGQILCAVTGLAAEKVTVLLAGAVGLPQRPSWQHSGLGGGRLREYLRQYVQCITISNGLEDCSSEFRRVRNAHTKRDASGSGVGFRRPNSMRRVLLLLATRSRGGGLG